MTKNTLTIACVLLVCVTTVFAQQKKADHFTVLINVHGLARQPKKLFISYLVQSAGNTEIMTDSTIVRSGRAVFKGTIAEPVAVRLQTDAHDNSVTFCLSAHPIYITTGKTIADIRASGSPYQQDFAALMRKELAYRPQLDTLNNAYILAMRAKDGVKANQYNQRMQDLQQKLLAAIYKSYYIRKARINALSVYALSRYRNENVMEMDSLYSLLSPRFRNTPTALSVKADIGKGRSLAVGHAAPGFSQPDTAGKMISLSSFRGKYVLVDFWATWCHPCRQESPYMIKAYRDFKDKNFTILSVSMDEAKSRRAWMEAMHADQVTGWTQVSDLKGFNTAVAALYNISAIPRNFLIDPDGNIVAKDLRGEELGQTLRNILK